MPVGAYYQSWSAPWVSVGAMLDLANIPNGIGIVYISFGSPHCTYVKGSNSFSGTGEQFSMDFITVKNAIAILKTRSVKVMISVGGASYPYGTTFSQANAGCIWDFCVDIGADGIDIDWEGNGISENQQFVNIINYLQIMRPVATVHYLSAACFSVGAFAPSGNPNNGMNILGLQQAGKCLDWINIMAYDAGPPAQYDVAAAYAAYRSYYSGPIYLGLEVGPQAWGGDLLNASEIVKAVTVSNGYLMIWSIEKAPTGTSTVADILKAAAATIVPIVIPPIVVPAPVVAVTTSTLLVCPKCNNNLLLEAIYPSK